MKKTELLHVHSLLGTVARDLADDELSESDLEAYRSLDVSPMTIRASREDHEAAVLELVDALAAAVESEAADEADSRQTLAA